MTGGRTEPVGAAVLKMSHYGIIRSSVLFESDLKGLVGEMCNHQPVWTVSQCYVTEVISSNEPARGGCFNFKLPVKQ